MKKLILLRGVSGAGKSTFANLIKNMASVDVAHFEADMYFYQISKDGSYQFDPKLLPDAHKWCKDSVSMLMGKLATPIIIVSNTFTQEWEMRDYFKLAENYGYQVTSLIVENRHGNQSIHDVPDETIEKMKNRFSVKL